MSSCTYGIKKELDSNQNKESLRYEIAYLENSIKLAESEVTMLNDKIKTNKTEFAKQNEVKLLEAGRKTPRSG